MPFWKISAHEKFLVATHENGTDSEDTNPWHPDYGRTTSLIVRAKSEEEARQVAKANVNKYEDFNGFREEVWTDPKWSVCEELDPNGPAEVLMEYFVD
jgi:hypothetical protein